MNDTRIDILRLRASAHTAPVIDIKYPMRAPSELFERDRYSTFQEFCRLWTVLFAGTLEAIEHALRG